MIAFTATEVGQVRRAVAFICSRSRRVDLIEDIFGETLLAAWLYGERPSFNFYCRVALFRLTDIIRHERCVRAHEKLVSPLLADLWYDVDDELRRAGVRQVVRSVVAGLSPIERDALEAEQGEHGDLARRIGRHPSRVTAAKCRARQRIHDAVVDAERAA